jgi:hypothetical protein
MPAKCRAVPPLVAFAREQESIGGGSLAREPFLFLGPRRKAPPMLAFPSGKKRYDPVAWPDRPAETPRLGC